MKFLKNGFILLFVCLLFIDVNAQVEAGKYIIGGSSKLGFSFMKTKTVLDGESFDGDKQTEINIDPQFGYFIFNGFALGVEIPLSHQLQKYEVEGHDLKGSINSIIFAPFVRYYFDTNKVKPFLHGSFGLGSITQKETGGFDDFEETDKLAMYSIGGGIGVFVNDYVSFDFGLSYSSTSSKQDGGDSDMKIVRSGVNVGVGIIVAF